MSLIKRSNTAKVIRYNRRRGFGIAKYDGKKIIFHIRNYSEVEIANGRKDGSIKFGAKTKCERLPEIGDRICFKGGSRKDRTTQENRPCAVAWYFKEDVSKKITLKKQNKELGRSVRSRKGRKPKYRRQIPCYA
jgi:hypothetical protein